jgi:hypothetical protein
LGDSGVIVTRTLAANEHAIYGMAGSGFSIVAASGAINSIEFLRQGKVIEDLLGTFGQGFYFKAPDGSIFDGVRFKSFSGGTFSVFIGYGVAGILEPDNARAVNVTNSSIGVDVQNAILNASISNSSLDVDIITPSVTVDPNEVGKSARALGPTAGALTATCAAFTVASGNIVTVKVACEYYSATPGTLSVCSVFTIKENGVAIGSWRVDRNIAAENSALQFTKEIYSSTTGSNTYSVEATTYNVAPCNSAINAVFKNLAIKATI